MRARTGVFALAACGACAVLVGAACTDILGIQTLSNGTPPSPDSGDDVMEAGAPDVSCDPLHPFARPNAADTDASDFQFTLATYSFKAGLELTSGDDIYYDLDNACTCSGAPNSESCQRPDAASPDSCDLSRGRDGTGNLTLKYLHTYVSGVSDKNLIANLDQGIFGMLATIRGYDGAQDDPNVQVDIIQSHGTVQESAPGVPMTKLDHGVNVLDTPALKRDGTDEWSYDPNDGTADDAGLISSDAHDGNAYVAGGVLVAHFPVLRINVDFKLTNDNPIVVRITDAIVSATVTRIDDAGAPYQLDNGKVAGRWRLADMLAAFGGWTDPFGSGNEGICPGSPAYAPVQSAACPRRDVRSVSSEDGKNLPCDSLSFGIGFTAGPAKVWGPWQYPYRDTTCFDASVATGPPVAGDPCQ